MIRIEDGYLKFDFEDIYINKNTNLPKKITGHSFVALIEKDKFKTKGDCVIDLLKILPQQPIDEFFTNRGKIAEKLIEKSYLKEYKRYITYDAEDIKYDNFQDNKYFGGMVDGLCEGTTIIEVKSKSLKDYDYITKNAIENEEYQAKLYATLWEINDVVMEYVFFPPEIEEKIKAKQKIESFKGCQRFQKKLLVNHQEIIEEMKKALVYYMNCYKTLSIPLQDISNNYMQRLMTEKGLKLW